MYRRSTSQQQNNNSSQQQNNNSSQQQNNNSSQQQNNNSSQQQIHDRMPFWLPAPFTAHGTGNFRNQVDGWKNTNKMAGSKKNLQPCSNAFITSHHFTEQKPHVTFHMASCPMRQYASHHETHVPFHGREVPRDILSHVTVHITSQDTWTISRKRSPM